MSIQSVGIVGAGQMGNGIAHVFALAGFDVVINDVSADTLGKSLEKIAAAMDRRVQKEKISQSDRDAAMKRIKASSNLADIGKCDLIIEAATEKESIKNVILSLDTPAGPAKYKFAKDADVTVVLYTSRTVNPVASTNATIRFRNCVRDPELFGPLSR